MIAYIKGGLEVINENAIIVEANGVGYEIICPNPFYFQDKWKETVIVYTYHYVREDTQVLYGFKHPDDKLLFSKILNVSGIGPKGALAILATVGVNEFVVAIEEENEKFLTGFPGVGKKTARQMILDLKGKLPFDFSIQSEDKVNTDSNQESSNKAVNEALEALKSLGYSEKEIKSIVPKLKNEALESTDDLVRRGLALLMK
ncbi:Holliday junction branch migration protein RuvA [Aquibacillus salsiterrae]|uniref:Holliday junction branch migration complex subunit RuvA n=1 Tax=Aquibacillus salsiterrae TaxID=2950439 RepID=A0A9X4ADN5_9BACI|nr:Holliday junction branch migration protein RuvA [Aquibacillus salsiterrae]MDC3415646.1 Holliday junction branch migration protein RuvA [Aquibacillus salsiterrae]